MGEAGLISRVLAKKFGAFLTFASLDDESATAPGQVTIHDMKRLYRWDAISPKTKVYGVVGCPVMHSMSPAIHNAAFDAVGHDGVYLPMLVNPGYESFKAFMESFLAFEPLDLPGCRSRSRTRKTRCVSEGKRRGRSNRSPSASARSTRSSSTAIHSVLSVSPQSSRGINTDYAAILDTHHQHAEHHARRAGGLPRRRHRRRRHRPHRRRGARRVRRDRRRLQPHQRAGRRPGDRIQRPDAAKSSPPAWKSSATVAATSTSTPPPSACIRMSTPAPSATRRRSSRPKRSSSTRSTTRWKPNYFATPKAAGAKTVGGIEMFVRQAAGQFEAWTQKPAPLDLFRRVIEGKLKPQMNADERR